MSLLDRLFRKEPHMNPAAAQVRQGSAHPFEQLNSYVPLRNAQYSLYRSMREAVPVLDAAADRLTRLKGGFRVTARNPNVDKQLQEFVNNVRSGGRIVGLSTFVDRYFNQLLELGSSAAEIIPTARHDDIYALKLVDMPSIRVKEHQNGTDIVLCQEKMGFIEPVPLPYQQLLLYSALNPPPDSPYGCSLFSSLPFVSSILLTIMSSIKTNWDRFGNVRYAVTYTPDKDALDAARARERAAQIEKTFSEAVKSGKDGGAIKDFFAVGDISVKVIGADNQILECQAPMRVLLEQVVSKTGLPPFLLGFSWSSTERMSGQQADLLTSELETYRRILVSPIKQIIGTWMALNGIQSEFSIEWDEINLQDMVEESRARLYNAQAREKEIANTAALVENGYITREEAEKMLEVSV